MTIDLTKHLPLISIIRGVTPDNVIAVGQALVEEGFTMIEVPLNSPDALTSIKKLVAEFGTAKYLIGAGTVTNAELARQVIATGANLIVTPNCDPQVIALAVASGCATFPGVVTPTEAFNALHAGATGLKLFPVSMVGIEGMKAMLSVFPKGTGVYPVGGISASVESMKPYLDAGAAGFGLGSALYKPGMSIEQVRENARQFVTHYRASITD
ncbi:2-dehydro-3-deoxy-6-phosphogalactonate aldolase [Thalassotalea mangrovi]|uniref:2-dehydro-3-deoxy-6-phosphogalactonate aldolase n=1 Tax=Thalassotalea mangrovi TaxID=2572245 RepID=A0A4V5NTY2_9GAMM|nr:2-dehydro-3-deoxy-6-phosphogalactonate aldolase [Thalassotalea mangrovi]TKB43669.1 2-dehydro-3-deoxy-6-phosphogalactonate aldolase [Thalassotalea mangrovi]